MRTKDGRSLQNTQSPCHLAPYTVSLQPTAGPVSSRFSSSDKNRQTSVKFQVCGAKDTFLISEQPGASGAHLVSLPIRSEGQLVPQHGGGQNKIVISMYYS